MIEEKKIYKKKNKRKERTQNSLKNVAQLFFNHGVFYQKWIFPSHVSWNWKCGRWKFKFQIFSSFLHSLSHSLTLCVSLLSTFFAYFSHLFRLHRSDCVAFCCCWKKAIKLRIYGYLWMLSDKRLSSLNWSEYREKEDGKHRRKRREKKFE